MEPIWSGPYKITDNHIPLILIPHIFWQLLEAETARAIFQDNIQLCNEVTERVVQHFVHCIETHGRHVQYLRFLQTIVKCEGTYIRKCQDTVMAEVRDVDAWWLRGKLWDGGWWVGGCMGWEVGVDEVCGVGGGGGGSVHGDYS